MWEELKRRLKGVRASNANQKFAQLEAAWKSIPMTVVQTLLDSMPRRCQAVIDAKGYPTKSSVSRHGRSQNRSTQIHHGNEHEDKRSRGIGRRPRLESVEAAPKEVKEKKEDPAEINERRRSIVAIGVPEATITLMFERSVADINAVNELLKCVDATSPPVTAYRLGRQREDNNRENTV
uniref:Uncharacterized protein n=1 Tax=Caenorhabditis japonica TaxID=281687 RepID=A0A8R1EJP8_CAEJA